MAAELIRFIRRKTDSQSAKIEDILSGISTGSDIPLDHIATAAGASVRMVERIAKQTANLSIVDGRIHKDGKSVRTNPAALRRGAFGDKPHDIHHQPPRHRSRKSKTILETSGKSTNQ